MTSSRNMAQSRPASSRATSVARDTLRRRDRPYRTEQATVRVKKRKLDLHTSYKKAPPGYTFLPVGTPDLADLCKELSRQRGLPVNVVNAKPMSKHATDPQKVSHHIHRIGYHFKSEVVDEASQQLGYIFYRGKFLKEEAMQAQRSKGRIKNIMAKYGLSMHENDARETPEQVSAYIKELFPRIPQDDLDKIVQHAWEEGSKRVGTNEHMNLANRVQLAVTARIRHAYTDYDRLLKAFEWKEARAEVEPECVKKLKEWRGEDGTDDEEKGFEEAMRDVIIIDDDDDPMQGNGTDLSDEDDASVGDADYDSDSSVEIIEHHISDNDFAAESALRNSRPSTHLSQREWARQEDVRDSPRRFERVPQVRPERQSQPIYAQSVPPPAQYAYPSQPPQPQYTPTQPSQPLHPHGTPQTYHTRPNEGDLGRYILQPQQHPPEPNRHRPYVYQPQPQPPLQPQPYDLRDPQQRRVVYASEPYSSQPLPAPHDQPIPSIERGDDQPPNPYRGVLHNPHRVTQTQQPTKIVDLTTPPPAQLPMTIPASLPAPPLPLSYSAPYPVSLPPPASLPPPGRMFYPVHGAPHPAQFLPR